MALFDDDDIDEVKQERNEVGKTFLRDNCANHHHQVCK